jgi:signal transduction histidine kinase
MRRILQEHNPTHANHFGLHLKLVLAGTITTFVGIALVSGFLTYRQATVLHSEIQRASQQLRAATVERGRQLAESMSASMENAIAGYNFNFVSESIQSVQERTDSLAYGFVTNAAGSIIVHTNSERVGKVRSELRGSLPEGVIQTERGSRIVEVLHPIEVGGSPWGTLVLAYDLTSLDEQATAAMLRGRAVMLRSTSVAVTFATIVSLFGITISVLLSRRLLRPVIGLAHDASAIASGNLDQEVRAVDSQDEIGFLARQFEHMRQAIKNNISDLIVAKERAESATHEEKRLRAQIEEHSKLLGIKVQERTAELQAINARLTENDRLKTEFLSNVSHELRSPLAAISSAAKIIGKYGDENKRTGQRFSDVIQIESRRLGRLINDLLDLAKIEAGRVEWNIERIDDPFDQLLAHVATTFRALVEEKGITMELSAPKDLPALDCDRDRMIQVLTNLCSNAMKFTPEGGRITISGEAKMHGSYRILQIAIQDTGHGIPEEELEKIFDRFHQVKAKGDRNRDVNKPKGTGLGLAICREVVNHHGGEIWAEAPEEGGARMVFFIPLAQGLPTSRAPEPESTPDSGGESAASA